MIIFIKEIYYSCNPNVESDFLCSKHEKLKIFSPLPKFSPSSSVHGIVRLSVSGRKRHKIAPISDSVPRTRDGSGLNMFDCKDYKYKIYN